MTLSLINLGKLMPFLLTALAAAGAGAVLTFSVAQRGDTVNNFDSVGGDVIVQSPAEVSAVEICEDPATRVALVPAPTGHSNPNAEQYRATLENAEARYDLTWQVDGTVVAVEILRGSEAIAYAEQIGEPFWDCIERKDVARVEGGNP